jgi:uncharacterized protein (TIGR02266 family)
LSEEGPYVSPEINKRQHRRARLVTQVRCASLGREEMLLSRDVSVGGVFVSTKEPFPMNSEVAVSMQLPSGGAAINAHGTIVYALKGLGMGVQFSDLSEASRTTLQKFVDESA